MHLPQLNVHSSSKLHVLSSFLAASAFVFLGCMPFVFLGCTPFSSLAIYHSLPWLYANLFLGCMPFSSLAVCHSYSLDARVFIFLGCERICLPWLQVYSSSLAASVFVFLGCKCIRFPWLQAHSFSWLCMPSVRPNLAMCRPRPLGVEAKSIWVRPLIDGPNLLLVSDGRVRQTLFRLDIDPSFLA